MLILKGIHFPIFYPFNMYFIKSTVSLLWIPKKCLHAEIEEYLAEMALHMNIGVLNVYTL